MKIKNTLKYGCFLALMVLLSACNSNVKKQVKEETNNLSLDSITQIAKQAYIYGYPMMDAYRIQHAYFVNTTNPEYKAPWNTLKNISHVYTSDDTAVQTPNSDTPYSMAGLDLRAEPMVLTIPKMEANRYFSFQLIDSYTFNEDYIGSRTTGNEGGTYMIAGPNWNGDTPEGITKVYKSDTEFMLIIGRTQLFKPSDLDAVKAIQDQYKLQPLSAYANTEAPQSSEPIDFIKPLTPDTQKSSLEAFNVLNFLLKFCPTNSEEKELMEQFAKIGVGAGKTIDVSSLSPEVKSAMEKGIKEAWTVDFANLKKQIDEGEITSGELFGTRAYLKNNYLYRMAGAILGIFGNSEKEAIYPIYTVDEAEQKLDATTNKYTLHFAEGELPPVHAFWSLTMYKLPSILLVENSMNRYLLNSPMLPDFKKDNDGGITLYIQNESPGKKLVSNWLPAPKGPFTVVMRLYWPKDSAMDGTWKRPELKQVID